MTDNEIVIREATIEDVPLIMQLTRELAEYEKLLDKVYATEDTFRENLFVKKYAEVIIAEYKNEAAGEALFFHNFSTFVGRPGIYLEDLFVRPHLRGYGIGKAMLLHIIELAKKRNCGRVEWAVLDWNEPAIGFYKKLGAEQMNDWRIFRLTL